MSFRIHTSSSELKRELEKKLAGLEDQLDGDFDYEISAEVLPAERALDRARLLAAETGADSIFVAAETFAAREAELPAPTHAEPATSDAEPRPVSSSVEVSNEQRAPSFDREKVWHAFAEKSAKARDLSVKLGSQTSSLMKIAGSASADALNRASKWAANKGAEARVVGGELRKRMAERAEQSRQSAAEWNARRIEKQAAEAKLRAERERAAHREAELAAAAAHIMHREQKKEVEHTPVRQMTSASPSVPKPNSTHDRDTWPIWRNAFAAAACLALVGIFLLAAGGKHTKASPATTTELAKPAIIVPEHFVSAAKPSPVRPIPAAPSANVAKPSSRKRVARLKDDGFQEVTVRHYTNASPAAAPKKDSKGVVQISDME